MENTKKAYEAPQLTVVSFKKERGFVGSNYASLLFWEAGWGNQLEDYSTRSGWTNDGSNTFWD